MNEATPPSLAVSHVVLVGHCGFDSPGLSRWAEQVLPGVEVVRVNKQAGLSSHLHGRSLLLINRVPDGRFDHGTSLDMIEAYSSQDDPPRMMLVSNYEDAQAEAVAAGAHPGVGKNDLNSPDANQRLLDAARA